MAPQRSASAPLPPFCSCLAKRERVASAYILRHVHTGNPFPTPPPARAVRPRPSRLGARVGPSDRSLPPPAPGGGLNTMRTRSAPIPIPTPPPARYARCPPPLPVGASNYFKPYHSTHLLCVRAHPRTPFCLCSAYRLHQAKLRYVLVQPHGRAKVIGLRTPRQLP